MEAFRPAAAERADLLRELGVGSDRIAWIEAIRSGLAADVFIQLARRLGVSEAELAAVVGLSSSTLARRKRAGALAPDEGEHVVRVAALLDRAKAVFGSESEAADWLTSTNGALGGPTPLAFADTEFGAREVEDLLGRLEHGVYG